MIANDSNVTASSNRIITALSDLPDETVDASYHQRETGDQINGFMLCALVSQSAKRIKRRAERVGGSLSMSVITRSILNAYLIAAKDHHGPFMNAKPDLALLSKINERVLQELLARPPQGKMNNNRSEPVRR